MRQSLKVLLQHEKLEKMGRTKFGDRSQDTSVETVVVTVPSLGKRYCTRALINLYVDCLFASDGLKINYPINPCEADTLKPCAY